MSDNGGDGHVRHERISTRAYHLWEDAGRPHGQDVEFWHTAETLIDAEDAAPSGQAHSEPPITAKPANPTSNAPPLATPSEVPAADGKPPPPEEIVTMPEDAPPFADEVASGKAAKTPAKSGKKTAGDSARPARPRRAPRT